VFEERMAALEGGVGAVATASGQAALFLAVATLAGAGDEIVSSAALYGGSQNLLANTLPRLGIHTVFVPPNDLEAARRAITPRTRLLFAETIGNPRLDVLDIEGLAAVAHGAGVPLVVDSTFATPYLCRPIEWGADIVMHSATKFIGGHGTSIAGVLVDGGRFDWKASARFPRLSEPDPGYHGVVFCEEFGPAAFVMKARLEGLRDFGACLSPGNAFYLLQGLETLPLRMARHVDNAHRVTRFLAEHPAVGWVAHPDREDSPQRARAAKYLPRGAGAIIAFGIKGGRAAGARFIESLALFSHLANVGDAKSLVIHPASTTHQQMSAEALASGGVSEDLVRLSVGLEDPQDLLDDLDRALKRSQKP